MSFILGLGTARPAHQIAQADSARLAVRYCATNARQARVLPQIYRLTTVAHRSSVLIRPHHDQSIDAASIDWFYQDAGHGNGNGNGKAADHPQLSAQRGPTTAQRMAQFRRHAPPLAHDAALAALVHARIDPASITHLLSITCTGFAAPGVELHLIRQLGLPRSVKRVQVGFMGCHAALNGLQVAHAICASDPAARVLMVCVELCSLHFQYGWDEQRVLANALFADGAAAAVFAAPDPATAAWRVRDTATCLIDDSDEEMSWHIGDHGFEMTLSPRVPDRFAEVARPWLGQFLSRHSLRIDEVASWAIHAGGPRIVSAVTDVLGLDHAKAAASRAVLNECGNMSSATLLFILDRLQRSGARPPCVMLGFGPGLTAEAALLAEA